ncbi:hypothetical protein ACFX1Q_010353 [Malus domestica]
MLVPHHNRCNFPDNEDEKSYVRSEHTSRVFQAPNLGHSFSGTHKVQTGSSTSSEFLYLGTVVNSRRLEERVDSRDECWLKGPKRNSKS